MEIINKDLPLVSVPVIVYNSAKTVIETLDSIYNQTYPNLELIVSDDCSTDNTVEICRQWIEEHKDRFVRIELLTAGKNTGTSGNCNRAQDACQGEWVKGIAGDDILLPGCIQDCMDYVDQHDDVVVLFGKQVAFGADEERCRKTNEVFDYQMMQESPKKQLHQLLFGENYIPATTLFYHKERLLATGVKNDERIPLLEDWPKWINLLRVGVTFHFIDKDLVNYRVGGISTSNKCSISSYKTSRMFYYLYQFPVRYMENEATTIEDIVKEESRIYSELINTEKHLDSIVNSHAYKLGMLLMKPIKGIKKYLLHY